MPNILVTMLTITVLGLAIFFAIRKMVKDKRSGIGACGCKCSECPHACAHKK